MWLDVSKGIEGHLDDLFSGHAAVFSFEKNLCTYSVAKGELASIPNVIANFCFGLSKQSMTGDAILTVLRQNLEIYSNPRVENVKATIISLTGPGALTKALHTIPGLAGTKFQPIDYCSRAHVHPGSEARYLFSKPYSLARNDFLFNTDQEKPTGSAGY